MESFKILQKYYLMLAVLGSVLPLSQFSFLMFYLNNNDFMCLHGIVVLYICKGQNRNLLGKTSSTRTGENLAKWRKIIATNFIPSQIFFSAMKQLREKAKKIERDCPFSRFFIKITLTRI